ncbi:hypothetical protein [Neisseria sicca]|uniref:hypothetical protein n=1 Tax=Neisseria sicca TaxID=490 RepID=UPI0039657017
MRTYNNRPAQIGFNTQPPEGGWPCPRLFRQIRQRFNTQPPEGGWPCQVTKGQRPIWFQHTAARRRLGLCNSLVESNIPFQHTAARRRLAATVRVSPT